MYLPRMFKVLIQNFTRAVTILVVQNGTLQYYVNVLGPHERCWMTVG